MIGDVHWHDRSFKAMGTTATLIVGDAPDPLVDWATVEIGRLEAAWTRFDPRSDLCALNASSGRWVEVRPILFMALTRAAALWRMTGGAFDPTILDALERAGYDRSFEQVPPQSHAPLSPARPAPGFADVELDAAGHAVRLSPKTRIDLGGIGKGLAADLVAEGLVDRGARSALVHLGGDMRAAGEAPDGGWMVPVEDPSGRVAFHHRLASGSLVQSTCHVRTWTRAGTALHHIIDPATGTSGDSDVTAVVVAGQEAWSSEGLAKAAIVLGEEKGRALLSDAHVDAWFFTRSVACSPS